jgi:uncharacterized protein YbjT (DUF2867 family)
MPASPEPARVVVAGATGRLGAIVDRLIRRGHSVLALTRDPRSAPGGELRQRGAEVAFADFDEPASVAAAAAGADAVFATGTAHRVGPDGELRHGLGIAEAADRAGVRQLVYVSGDGAAPASPLPLMRAKFAVEERIRASAVAYTILAPVYFMENLFNPWNIASLRGGRLPSPIAVGRPLQQAAVADVVSLGVEVIEHPAEFAGRRIAVASDELSAREGAAALTAVLDHPLEPVALDRSTLPAGLRALFAWLEEVGHAVDIAALRRSHPDVGWHDFGAWARAERHRFRELCPERVTVPRQPR